MQDLSTEKPTHAIPVLDKAVKSRSGKRDILDKWTEYYLDLYNDKTDNDPVVRNRPRAPSETPPPVLREEVSEVGKAKRKEKHLELIIYQQNCCGSVTVLMC